MQTMFQWIEHSWLGTSVNGSLWAFAAFEAGHLLALAVIGGAVLVVDLRTLGWVFPRQRVSASAMARSVPPRFLFGPPFRLKTKEPERGRRGLPHSPCHSRKL